MHSRFSEVLVMLAKYADELGDSDRPVPRRSRLRHFLRMKDRLPELSRLEQVLGIGNWLYRTVRLIEHNWRTQVMEGKTLYDPNEDNEIMDLYRQWMLPCQRCTNQIDSFISRRFPVQGGDEFKKNYMEARNILAGHNPFFDDDDNATRWAGLTAFLRPQPRTVHVDDDGRIFDASGDELSIPGLEPKRMLQARDEMRTGTRRTLNEIIASRNRNGI